MLEIGQARVFPATMCPNVRISREAIFRSRFINAMETERLGFVNLVVSRERLDEETMSLAHDIADNDPFKLRMAEWAAISAVFFPQPNLNICLANACASTTALSVRFVPACSRLLCRN